MGLEALQQPRDPLRAGQDGEFSSAWGDSLETQNPPGHGAAQNSKHHTGNPGKGQKYLGGNVPSWKPWASHSLNIVQPCAGNPNPALSMGSADHFPLDFSPIPALFVAHFQPLPVQLPAPHPPPSCSRYFPCRNGEDRQTPNGKFSLEAVSQPVNG